MSKYIGITVGPIFDTISDAATPGALWFASRMFSDITRRICKAITEEYKDCNLKIYSPYYSEAINMDDGVGKFHDRVIFSVDSCEVSKLEEIVVNVKKDTANCFTNDVLNEKSQDFFMNYLQIHYVVLEGSKMNGENCVLKISPYLDALELMKTFPADDESNPIGKLFTGEHHKRNEYIKNSPLFCKDYAQLCGANGIRSIEDIAGVGNRAGYKSNNYYVVVSADGDGMGAFLESISDDEVTLFSQKCLEYAEQAAAKIGEFGGMTIYAGGDDLLFLAPIINGNNNIFGLCNELSKLFGDKISEVECFKNKMIPTVSFGVSIQYSKYPLYEALDKSRELLYKAKYDGNEKNKVAVNLQKHSGQSVEFVISNNDYELITSVLELKGESDMATLLHSILHTLNNSDALINTLDKSAINESINATQYESAWKNFFDNDNQKQWGSYVGNICKIYYEKLLMKNKKHSLQTLCYLIKLKHFLEEKEGK